MERLWIREVRRAARRASAPFARRGAERKRMGRTQGLSGKVIRCRFDLDHEVFPGGFYDVRWFRHHHRWWLCVPHEFTATLPRVAVPASHAGSRLALRMISFNSLVTLVISCSSAATA
jgi:hypothetical protein